MAKNDEIGDFLKQEEQVLSQLEKDDVARARAYANDLLRGLKTVRT